MKMVDPCLWGNSNNCTSTMVHAYKDGEDSIRQFIPFLHCATLVVCFQTSWKILARIVEIEPAMKSTYRSVIMSPILCYCKDSATPLKMGMCQLSCCQNSPRLALHRTSNSIICFKKLFTTELVLSTQTKLQSSFSCSSTCLYVWVELPCLLAS